MNMRSFLILLVGFTLNCGSPQAYSQHDSPDQLQAILDMYVESNNDVHGAILHVESPDVHLSWTGASGVGPAG